MALFPALALVKFVEDNAIEVLNIDNIENFDDEVLDAEGGLKIYGTIVNVLWPPLEERKLKKRKKEDTFFRAELLDVGKQDDYDDMMEQRNKLAKEIDEGESADPDEDQSEESVKRKRRAKTPFSPSEPESKKQKTNDQKKPGKIPRAPGPDMDHLMDRILAEKNGRMETAKRRDLKELQDSDGDDDGCDSDDENMSQKTRPQLISRVSVLTMKLRQSRMKNRRLQDALTALRGIPQYLDRLEGVSRSFEKMEVERRNPMQPKYASTSAAFSPAQAKSSPAPTPRTKPSSTPTPSTKPSTTPTPPTKSSPEPTPPTPALKLEQLREPENPQNMIDEDETVLLTSDDLKKINHSVPSKLVADLMAAVYSEDEIVTKTIVQQPGQAESGVLDQKKMAAIKKYVRGQFSHIPDKSDSTDKPAPWEVRFNKLCRWKKSNTAKLKKKRDASTTPTVKSVSALDIDIVEGESEGTAAEAD